MFNVRPGNINLALIVLENGSPVTGSSLINVKVYDKDDTQVLSQTMTENSNQDGLYEYTWNASNVNLEEIYKVIYYNDSEPNWYEEYRFSTVEENHQMN